jgi:hypothetical protein
VPPPSTEKKEMDEEGVWPPSTEKKEMDEEGVGKKRSEREENIRMLCTFHDFYVLF